MVNCSAYKCKSRSERKEPGITFHSFPKVGERRQLWIANTKIDNWSPTKNARLCSKHFEKHWFYKSNTQRRVRLLHQAVPTIFPELPKYLQPKKIKRRAPRDRTSEPSTSTADLTVSTERKQASPAVELRKQFFREVTRSRQKRRKIRVIQSLKRRKGLKMVKNCCVYNCKSTWDDGNTKITYHLFPKHDPQRLQWITVMHRVNPDFRLSPSSAVCSKHFKKNDFLLTKGRTRLKTEAVPSIFEDSEPAGSKMDKTISIEKDPLEVDSSKLECLFGNNVEFIVEENIEDSDEVDVIETPKQSQDISKNNSKVETKQSSVSVSSSLNFNSSFLSFVNENIAKEEKEKEYYKTKIFEINERAAGRKRKLDDEEPKVIKMDVVKAPVQERSTPILLRRKSIAQKSHTSEEIEKENLITSTDNVSENQPPVQVTSQNIDQVLTSPVITQMKTNIQSLLQTPLPVVTKTTPTIQILSHIKSSPQNTNLMQMTSKTPILSQPFTPTLQVMPQTPPLQIIPNMTGNKMEGQTKIFLVNPNQIPIPALNLINAVPIQPVTTINPSRPTTHAEQTNRHLNSEGYNVIWSDPKANQNVNITTLLNKTKEYLSTITNKGTHNLPKAEYIMVVDSETNALAKKISESAPIRLDVQADLCYVPNCALKQGEKVFLFKTPFYDPVLEVWHQCIGRKDRPLKKTDAVCEKHFSREDIQVYVQNQGNITLAFPKLKKDAIPCVKYIDGCCVQGCRTTVLKMYKFPIADKNNTMLWLYLIKRPDLNKLPLAELAKYRVCRKHFDESSFDENGEMRKASAPTLYIPEKFYAFVENEQLETGVPYKCIFANCLTNHIPGSQRKVFLFPGEFDKCKAWLTNCKRNDLIRSTVWSTLVNLNNLKLGVCSRHFKPEDHVNEGDQQLKPDAVPTLEISDRLPSWKEPPQVILSDEGPNLRPFSVKAAVNKKINSLKCAVKTCQTGVQKYFPIYSFPDPVVEKERYYIWLKLCGNPELETKPTSFILKNYGVCQGHFKQFFYTRLSKEDILSSVAVPTKDLPGPKTWLFGTKFYRTKVKRFIKELINADTNDEVQWKISDYIDAEEDPKLCVLDKNKLNFPAFGYHLEFKRDEDSKKPAYEVFKYSKRCYGLINDYEPGEMIKVNSIIVIADDDNIERTVLQELIDASKKNSNSLTKESE